MARPFQIVLIIFLVLICESPGLTQSVDLPLEHWAYQFIDRLITKGLFNELGGRSRPMSRMEIAKIILKVEERLSGKNIELTTTERDILEQLKGEFHEELEKLNVRTKPRYRERHLFTWSEADNMIHADFDFAQTLDIRRGDQYAAAERISHTMLGGILRGNFKQSLGFYISVRNILHRGTEITGESYDPSKGIPISLAGKNVYTDEAIAYFVWNLPWFQLQLGRNKAKWGPGYRGSLMLSEQNPLFDMIKLKAQFKRFHFTSIHGHLNSGYGQKYLAAHRLEIKILPWLYLAGSEAVIYGNRDIEIQYLNPIMPYHVAEHHLGDQDNNTIGFDLTAFPLKNVKTYFELFLDDFTLSENPFTYYGNKFGFLTGAFWVEPFGLKNTDFRVEYARLEPYVYTHHDTINIYQNYDQCIGHWLGPNADAWFMEINYIPSRDLKFSFSFERIRKGEGDINTAFDKDYSEKKEFLTGVIERKHSYGFKITDQLFRDVFLSLEGYLIQTKNLNRIKDKNATDSLFSFELLLNY